MDGDSWKAKLFRQRAEELRKIAESMPEGNTKRIMLSIVVRYEQIAGFVGEEEQTDSAIAGLKKRGNES